MASSSQLRKILTANDVGATGSHQAGICVPKSLLAFFPSLDASVSNPDVWLNIKDGHRTHRWRFIHYNNKILGSGTRDEYRLTHVHEFLHGMAAGPGDALELQRTGAGDYKCRVVANGDDEDSVVLSTTGSWRVVALRRR